MTAVPSWLPENTYFRVGCMLSGSFVFQGLRFANKLSQVQRVPHQVVFGAHQGWVTLAHLPLEGSVRGAEVLTEPALRAMFIYISSPSFTAKSGAFCEFAHSLHLQFSPLVIPGWIWLGLSKWRGTETVNGAERCDSRVLEAVAYTIRVGDAKVSRLLLCTLRTNSHLHCSC